MKKIIKPRNPIARSPLLKKGGPHGKSTRAIRTAAKRLLKEEIFEEMSGSARHKSGK